MRKLISIFFIFLFSLAFAQKNENYIRIDFSSICCGPPSEKPLVDFIENFRKENKLKDFEIWQETGLGHEGEYALYIGIDQLKCKKKKKEKFITGMKTLINTFTEKRNNNQDGHINFREDLVKKEELIKKQKTPSNRFSKIQLRTSK